ncbi:MAG: hypothetical protein ILP24_06620 [Paludibacteraceae bacterium]|nr:hypothetical protein [Bacteroidota bacterium]MBP5135417.1 hypothetical protein [Paludibacteraceae bacterium]
MKKFVLLGFAALVFVGCTVSPEKKAASIVEKAVKESLYHPNSYDPIGTIVDSAFAPMDDPNFFEKTLKLYELGVEMDDCDREMKHAKSSMAIWCDSYDAFSRNEYNEAKEEYEKYETKMETLQKKGEKLGEELKGIAQQGRSFIGWKVTHSYRAQNNAGLTLIGETVFILDPDMTQILAGYDTDDRDYKKVQMMYEMMKASTEE